MKKLISSLLILMSLTGLANADTDPSNYLEGIAKDMIAVVEKNKEALKTNDALAKQLVRKHLLPAIDKDAFSRLTLGSKTWDSLTEQQKTDFIDGYISRVIDKYAKGLSLYDGQAFVFEKTEISSKTGNARVKSAMKQADSTPLDIHYYLAPHADNWLITNIIVAGTDMRKSYRNQFLPRINEVGFDEFLAELKLPE